RGDRRDLGVRISGARVDGTDVWSRAQLVRGFWGEEPPASDGEPGQWTTAHALLRLPVSTATTERAMLRLAAPRPVAVRVGSADSSVEVEVTEDPRWHEVPLRGPLLTILNNVGTELTADGHGADRGYFEPDDGRFDEATDVFAWCGAGVLLR